MEKIVQTAGRNALGDFAPEFAHFNDDVFFGVPAGVKHWHGAAPDSWFSHLAVEVPGENCSNEWLEAVSDEDYRSIKE